MARSRLAITILFAIAVNAFAASPSSRKLPDSDATVQSGSPKVIVPIYTHYAGEGNQAVEFASAVLIARLLNRTVCLPDFFHALQKNTDGHVWGLKMSERYDLDALKRFVPIMAMDDCVKTCGGQLDTFLQLRSVEPWSLFPEWNQEKPYKNAVDLNWTYLTWTSAASVQRELAAVAAPCAALGGIFPGLRWRGAHLALAPFLKPAAPVRRAAQTLLDRAFVAGGKGPYMAVHWRFEQASCAGEGPGLCFPRCRDGSEPNDPVAMPMSLAWVNFRANGSHCPAGKSWPGVHLVPEDIIAAIVEKASSLNLGRVYVATDGWMLGEKGCPLLTKVIKGVRAGGLEVAGTWFCPGLAPFQDESRPTPSEIAADLGVSGGKQVEGASHSISAVEQEVAMGADAFIGTGESAWSLAVWRRRQGLRLAAKALMSHNMDQGGGWETGLPESSIIDDHVIDKLMADDTMAGPACRRSLVGEQFPDKDDDESQTAAEGDARADDWLDRLACEGRQEKGGRCQMAICW